jgi:hypothetical protein
MPRSLHRTPAGSGGKGWQSELPPSPQLTLNFEPSLPERFPSLRAYVAFRVQEQRLHAATLAGKMDLSPSVLSRKLNQPEGDSNRLTCDDLEGYIRETGDLLAVMEYLAAKYSPGGDDARRARVLSRAERLFGELADLLPALKGVA